MKTLHNVYFYFTGENEVKVNLEMLTGKVNQGTGTIVGFKEDSKNLVKPGYYILKQSITLNL